MAPRGASGGVVVGVGIGILTLLPVFASTMPLLTHV